MCKALPTPSSVPHPSPPPQPPPLLPPPLLFPPPPSFLSPPPTPPDVLTHPSSFSSISSAPLSSDFYSLAFSLSDFSLYFAPLSLPRSTASHHRRRRSHATVHIVPLLEVATTTTSNLVDACTSVLASSDLRIIYVKFL